MQRHTYTYTYTCYMSNARTRGEIVILVVHMHT
jgi:hypothetical protein